ncbi:2TM domain-containing protein [Chryseobacterium gregarium]|uniref:2TM domain-containing protein n=1 Tax=Chryseobacterium gregarium TaxID=456299 RepID=UPI0004018C1C|nr:2TM domain-containing protein [Chryseobacterium gregarium]
MNYNQAQQRVSELKKFYKSLLWFGIISFIILYDDIIEKGIFNFSVWNGSVILLIWGIILITKAVRLFVLDGEWEREVMEKEMNKTKKPIQF